MGVLEQVTQMKEQGFSDQEIIGNLQQQGISPREITNALSQSQIKDAISTPELVEPEPAYTPQSMEENQQYMPPPQQIEDQGTYAPQEQEAYAPQTQEFYPQEGYDNYASGDGNTGTMIEVSEQVFSEKVKKIKNRVEDLNEFKTIAQTQITSISERLARIETTMDKLQSAILDKVGSYGSSLETIKKEMTMMQDSFGKVVNQAVRHKK